MIIQSLCKYYECLMRQGKISKTGWQCIQASYGLLLDANGVLQNVISLKQEVERGKNIPQLFPSLPARETRTSRPKSFFLCDNSAYILGFDDKGKPSNAIKCFKECQKHHEEILKNGTSKASLAVKNFFAHWDPKSARENPLFADYLADILKDGGNFLFLVDGKYAHEDPEIRALWQERYDAEHNDGPVMQCLVSGKKDHIAKLHPPIKNVKGSQATGAFLVSFNLNAFESYGLESGYNSPISKHDAFAYGAALNYLLRDRDHKQIIGDTTIVAWAENGESCYQDAFMQMFNPSGGENEVLALIRDIARGEPFDWNESTIDPAMPFYILGLAPNAARLSIRFFLKNSIGTFARNIKKHYDRLEISQPSYENERILKPWRLANETVNQNSRDKTPSPQLSGNLLQSILMDTPYPMTLYDGIELRIKADHDMNWRRAAAIKAFLLKNATSEINKEALTVKLNEDCTYTPYVLGRLFSVLESIQDSANPDIKTTIKDRYFNSACATPSVVFPILIKLAQSHLRKTGGGLEVVLNKQLGDLLSLLTEGYPNHLSLYDQGIMQLGYYHQTQKRFEKKNREDK